MKYLLRYKQYLLYVALALTLVATAYFKYQDLHDENSTNLVEVSENKASSDGAENDQSTLQSAKAMQVLRLHNLVDIFDIYKKEVPKVVEKKAVRQKVASKVNPVITMHPAEINPPTAPVIPFKYIGKIWGDDEYQVFISFNGKNLIIKEGETIQQTYKVEKISPPTMTLTYIPMNILQSMQIGEPN
ncbi:MAG: hypothetical protein HOO90_10880 [Methylotenera sp.]|uniref:hypothetical protein n=1 Tax=Methylotenera sp. TaxID=2051956 RepID=UPI0017CFA113|nr:hypothetical protein [Methylotenera sp.]NOU26023.1 hypothetical protein [Methylotenera sp.]